MAEVEEAKLENRIIYMSDSNHLDPQNVEFPGWSNLSSNASSVTCEGTHITLEILSSARSVSLVE